MRIFYLLKINATTSEETALLLKSSQSSFFDIMNKYLISF